MSKINHTECDVCDCKINKKRHIRFRRWLLGGFWLRMYDWGIVDMAPVDVGWRKKRVDICESCWSDVVTEVSNRINE